MFGSGHVTPAVIFDTHVTLRCFHSPDATQRRRCALECLMCSGLGGGFTSAVCPFDRTASTAASSFSHGVDGVVAVLALAFMLTVDPQSESRNNAKLTLSGVSSGCILKGLKSSKLVPLGRSGCPDNRCGL